MKWHENAVVNAQQISSFFDPRYKDLRAEKIEAREAIKTAVLIKLDDGLDSAEDTQNQISQESALDFLFQCQPSRYTSNPLCVVYCRTADKS